MARRRRYTVTTASGDRHVALAYTSERAAQLIRDHGHVVVDVEPGDYRRKVVPIDGGWQLDQVALAQAIAQFGLQLPVTIKRTGHQGGRWGAHVFRPRSGRVYNHSAYDTACGGMTHAITIKTWLTAEQASQTIWHELCHAAQAERACQQAGAVTEREQTVAWADCCRNEARGYADSYDTPTEQEARDMEQMHETLALATPVGRTITAIQEATT